MKKAVSVTLTAVILVGSASSLFACAKKGGEKIDPNRTQLYVNVYECGVGTTFASDPGKVSKAVSLKEKFEELNPEVQVIVRTADVNGVGKQSAIGSGDTDVFYMANFDISQYANIATATSDYLADITDIVTEGGENSIASKMFKDSRQYFNLGTEEAPKYFCLPWFSSYMGTVYDVGLFKEEHLYSNDPEAVVTYAGLDCEEGTEDDNYGPDGKPETFDDGLPATWEDMKVLLEYMVGNGMLPFSWAYQDNYASSWLNALWGSYEGYENYSLMTDFDGTYTYHDENGDLKTKTVDETNGYEMAMQNGKLAAVTVAHYIIRNGWYDERSIKNSQQSAFVAQENFVKSVEDDDKRVAFLMEGTWWENEAKKYFDEMVKFTGNKAYAYGTREFGYMPFPKFIGSADIPDQVNTKISVKGGGIGSSTAAVLISKNSKHLDIAKSFLKLAYSDEMNEQFNIASGVSKPFSYKMSEENLKLITPYQANVYEISQSENVESVSGLTRSKYAINGATIVEDIATFSILDSKNIEKGDPFIVFKESAAMTVKSYMEGVAKNNTQEKWNSAPWGSK